MLAAFGDGSLFGATYGEAPFQVLALHGWQRTHRDFDAVLDAFPGATLQGAEVAIPSIALDLPGFGASPAPSEAWGSGEYADAVAVAFSKLDTPAVVLGHSFGGRVALQLAARRPELVRHLLLSGVPFRDLLEQRRTQPKLAYRLTRHAHRIGLLSDAQMERARLRYGSRDYREASGVLRQVLVRTLIEQYGPLLEAVKVPTTLVWGELDMAAPLVEAKAALSRLPEGELVVLDGVGHLVPTEAPRALRDVIVGCLR